MSIYFLKAIIGRLVCVLLAIATGFFFNIQSSMGAEAPGIATWLSSDKHLGIRADSRIPNLDLKVVDESGVRIENAQDLEKAGWIVKRDGFIETPPQAGGGKIDFTLTNLPVGKHNIYVRYFTKPRADGESWWYHTLSHFNDRSTVLHDMTPGRRLIAGLGGQDPNTLYEVLIGTSGSEAAPTDAVSFGVSRYEWSQISRLGPIRIESFPEMGSPTPLPQSRIDEILSPFASLSLPNSEKLFWGVTSSSVKARPTKLESIAGMPFSQEVKLKMALGEYENAQILLYSSTSVEVKSIKVSPLVRDAAPVGFLGKVMKATGLDQEKSAEINPDHVLVAPLGYVQEQNKDNLASFGYWPDPIMTHVSGFTIKPGLLQGLWVRVFTPRDTSPGTYRGTVSFLANGTPVDVPMTVLVRDWSVPEWPTLPFLANKDFDEFFSKYYILPGSIYGFPEGDPVEIFKEWEKYKPSHYTLGYFPGTAPGDWPKDYPSKQVPQQTLEKWSKSIRERLAAAKTAGMTGVPYIYLWDECSAAWRPALQQTVAHFRKEFPDLFMVTTAHVPEDGTALEDIDVWVMLTPKINGKTLDAVNAAGKEPWIYVCNSPAPPADNVFITSLGSGTRRLLGWLPSSFGAKGFLYWGFNVNRDRQPKVEDDLFTPWQVFNYGDGDFLVEGPKGPLPTQRLELIRDGLEDHSYITIAHDLYSKLIKSRRGSDRLKALLPEVEKILASSATPYVDERSESERIQRDSNWREKLAEFIAEAKKQ